MRYKELKKHLLQWLNEQNEPVPLNVGNYLLSTDIRTNIRNNIEKIDLILHKHGKPTNYARTLLVQLNKIKTAIDEGSHDISGFGWSVLDKYLENESTETAKT
jgi:hypothetical protein